ncbi:hypothetical protein LTR09_004210 [Extremus antarcticus]|uniref:Uncharacterized protein n=1 Tax=Extremus antarcticus TaxID=702011 RepID=A0AAJ0GD76_9PEZI|nr:hypothetical protein LTR09_004210 [Extremus antarcticus]
MMYRDREVCHAVYSGIPPGTPVFGLAGTTHEEVAKELNLPFVAELYGDVKYSKDGTLVIDRKKKAWSSEDIKTHISSQIENSSVTAVTGEEVELPIGVHSPTSRPSTRYLLADLLCAQDHPVSLCCHSDSPGAVQIVTAARQIVDEFNKAQGYT